MQEEDIVDIANAKSDIIACDLCTTSTLFGGKVGPGPGSLHTLLEGQI